MTASNLEYDASSLVLQSLQAGDIASIAPNEERVGIVQSGENKGSHGMTTTVSVDESTNS
jgi:hypothetical protein